jgi:muramidase (phage lysozyme)
MANVVDALVVSLGLDPSDFIQKSAAARADLKKTGDAGRRAADETEGNVKRATTAAGKNAQQLDAWGKGAAESLGKLRDSFVGLLAAIAGGTAVTKLLIDTTQAEAATGRLAHNLMIPVQTLSEWQQSMRLFGGSAEDANSSLQGVQGLMQQSAFGNLDASRTMAILGISRDEDPSQALVSASKFFSTHNGALDQQMASQAGISQSMLNFLEQGPAKVQATLATEAPSAMTPKEVADATALQKEFGQLQNTFQGIVQELTDAVNPGLQTFLGWLQKIADWGLKHPEQFGAATAAASVLSGAAGASILRKLAQSILGRGGANAPKEAEEAVKAAEVIEAGGSVALSPALAAALGIYATNALGEPGIDPNESAELRRLYPNAPRGTTATVDRTLPPVAQTFLNSIASGESGGDYSREYGNNPDFTSFADHPRQEFQTGVDANGNPINTSAAGRYQFEAGTWDRAAKALGLTDFSPANQDKAAWWLAQQDYGSRTGRDLLTDLRAHDPKTDALIQQSLAATWTSLKARSPGDFASSLNDTTPPPAPPASALAGPINALKRLTGQDKSASSHTGEYQSRLTGQWLKMPPINYEPPLPQGLVDAMNQMKAPAPTAATAALIARHGALASSAASARHISTTNHGPVNSHNTSNAETHVHIGTVNTQAKTGDGITRSLSDAIKKNSFLLFNANTGLA